MVCAQQQLLPRLTPCIKRPGNLCTAERAVGKVTTVFTGKRNALRNTLVDNVNADLCQTVDIGLARTEIATLDGVVEQPLNAVAVVLVILGTVDPTLCGNAVRTARAVLKTEAFNLVTQLGHGRRCRSSCQTTSHHNHIKLAFVGRVDQLAVKLVLFPLLGQGTGGNLGIQIHFTTTSFK